jgi:opacity protein-like surface antigen
MSGHHTPGETGLPTPSLPDSSSGSDTNSDNFISRLGINYFFSSNQSIDVSYEYSQYALSNNVDIQGNVISLDYFYKF